jgi:hypothetical protein
MCGSGFSRGLLWGRRETIMGFSGFIVEVRSVVLCYENITEPFFIFYADRIIPGTRTGYRLRLGRCCCELDEMPVTKSNLGAGGELIIIKHFMYRFSFSQFFFLISFHIRLQSSRDAMLKSSFQTT